MKSIQNYMKMWVRQASYTLTKPKQWIIMQRRQKQAYVNKLDFQKRQTQTLMLFDLDESNFLSGKYVVSVDISGLFTSL